VQRRGLALINELVAFITQLHGTGIQYKFKKSYNSSKFSKLSKDNNYQQDVSFLDQFDPNVAARVVTRTITDGRTDARTDDGHWVVRDLDAL
jgi:hypothetical protein